MENSAEHISQLRAEIVRLERENSELRSQLEWHPIGPNAVAVHAPAFLPLGETEPPPAFEKYLSAPSA